MICENLTEFYQISLKIVVNLTDFSPQLMACIIPENSTSNCADKLPCRGCKQIQIHADSYRRGSGWGIMINE